MAIDCFKFHKLSRNSWTAVPYEAKILQRRTHLRIQGSPKEWASGFSDALLLPGLALPSKFSQPWMHFFGDLCNSKDLLMTTAEAESRLYNDPITRFKHSVQDNNNKYDYHSISGKIDSRFYYTLANHVDPVLPSAVPVLLYWWDFLATCRKKETLSVSSSPHILHLKGFW